MQSNFTNTNQTKGRAPGAPVLDPPSVIYTRYIYNFGIPFLSHHDYTLSLYVCLGA